MNDPQLTTDYTFPPYWRRLILFWWGIAIISGLIRAWDGLYVVTGDGVSYLDMGEAFWRGDWSTAINGVWSPLYAYLLGLVLHILNLSPFWEFPICQFVDVVIYLVTIGCFHFLLCELMQYHASRTQHLLKVSQIKTMTFPAWVWVIVGYTLFIWTSQNMYVLASESTPDLCVAAIVYLLAGMILRIRRTGGHWRQFFLLGSLLGLGYLTKAALFPLGLVFFAIALRSVRNFRKIILYAGVALLTFSVIGGPYLLILSKTKGRVTYSDTGRLNYIWFVNKIESHKSPFFSQWQGQPPENGAPLHPVRKIYDKPAVYEFGMPVGGTYPVHFDPSYWYEGAVVRFHIGQQIQTISENIEKYVRIFLGFQAPFVTGFLILCIFSRLSRKTLKEILAQWPLWLPAIANFAMYALVLVEERYIAPFCAIFWLGLFSGMRMKASRRAIALFARVPVVVTAIILFLSFMPVLKSSLNIVNAIRTGHLPPHEQWNVAEGLRQAGIPAGSQVAFIGSADDFAWARLAKVKIVAEIPPREMNNFWAASPRIQEEVMSAFKTRTPASIVIAKSVPQTAATFQWRQLNGTNYYVFPLKKGEQ